MNNARGFTAGKRVLYTARQEVAVEFGIDDVIRRRDIDELPDLVTDVAGEDPPIPPNYKLEEFKFLLEQTKIDIRRDRLTTLNSFIAAIQERSDSQATVVARLLQRVEAQDNGGFLVHSQTARERPFDANGDGRASPVDALIIINSLNTGGTQQLVLWPPLSELRTDINLDGFRSPLDALLIINFLNAAALTPSAEGEGFAMHLTPPRFSPWQPAAERAIAWDMSLNLGAKSTDAASERTVVPIWHLWADTNVAFTTEPAIAQIREFSLLDELDEILDDVVNRRATSSNLRAD